MQNCWFKDIYLYFLLHSKVCWLTRFKYECNSMIGITCQKYNVCSNAVSDLFKESYNLLTFGFLRSERMVMCVFYHQEVHAGNHKVLKWQHKDFFLYVPFSSVCLLHWQRKHRHTQPCTHTAPAHEHVHTHTHNIIGKKKKLFYFHNIIWHANIHIKKALILFFFIL